MKNFKNLKIILIATIMLTFAIGLKATNGENHKNHLPNPFNNHTENSLTVFTFALTHLNGKKLEKTAYFYAGENPFKLDLKDGKAPFKYYITGSLGKMCGLYGKDGYGKSMSICITRLNSSTTEVEIKYTDKTLRFTGYLVR